jgi:hypothetical protein
MVLVATTMKDEENEQEGGTMKKRERVVKSWTDIDCYWSMGRRLFLFLSLSPARALST